MNTRCFDTIYYPFSVYVQTPVEFCVKYHNKKMVSRRDEDESCPVFCASYWRPVCGANAYRGYVYRSFLNQCYMDMLNCRGDADIECKLCFCPITIRNFRYLSLMFANLHVSTCPFSGRMVLRPLGQKDYLMETTNRKAFRGTAPTIWSDNPVKAAGSQEMHVVSDQLLHKSRGGLCSARRLPTI